MNKRLSINLIASLISFGVNLGISTLLTPFLVSKLGTEAYGFIGISNLIISYASIITVAFNAVASRFISIEYHKKNYESVNRYYNSVLLFNICSAFTIMVIAAIFIVNVNYILTIPIRLVNEVKITFFIVILNFVVSMIASVFSISTFVQNRIDLTSVRTIISNVIKVICILGLFFTFKAKIYFISLATLIATLFVLITNYTLSKKLIPEIKISLDYVKLKYFTNIIGVSIWNSINKLSTLFLSGITLILTNVLVGSLESGYLSIAKTIPTAIQSLISVLVSVFLPKLTIVYAKDDIRSLMQETEYSARIISWLLIVPISGILICGKDFYSLWLPQYNPEIIEELQTLSVILLIPTFLDAITNIYYSINIITNKIKIPAIINTILGILTIIISSMLIDVVNNKSLMIVSISAIALVIKTLVITPAYAAIVLKQKSLTFYRQILVFIVSFCVITVFLFALRQFYQISTWFNLFVFSIVGGILSYIISLFIIFNRDGVNNIIKLASKSIKLKKNT